MERQVRKFPMLILATILVAMGLLIDGLVILKNTPGGLEFILFADIPIFMGVTLDLYFVLKGRKPEVGKLSEAPEADPLDVVENKDPPSDTYPEITSEMLQSANMVGKAPRSQAVYQPPSVQREIMRLESPKEPKYSYSKSHEKMNSPAFLCGCGHPHRFVCLNCGMTVDKALNKKGTRWLEWQPEMGSLP